MKPVRLRLVAAGFSYREAGRVLHNTMKVSLTIVEIWKGGATIGEGYAELARWMGARLIEMYPSFVYKSIERRDESIVEISGKLAEVVEAVG